MELSVNACIKDAFTERRRSIQPTPDLRDMKPLCTLHSMASDRTTDPPSLTRVRASERARLHRNPVGRGRCSPAQLIRLIENDPFRHVLLRQLQPNGREGGREGTERRWSRGLGELRSQSRITPFPAPTLPVIDIRMGLFREEKDPERPPS